MVDVTPFPPGLSPVHGKAAVGRYDVPPVLGGRIAGLVRESRRLGSADRLAACLKGQRAPERVVNRLAEIIRFRIMMIAAW